MFKILTLFVLLLAAGTSLSSLSRRGKRSLEQFKTMVECLTGRSVYDYNGYGCWCGKGGSGTPVDSLDSCCKAHDRCWDEYSDDSRCVWYFSPFFEEYSYSRSCGTRKSVTCDSSNTYCEQKLCDCDRLAAMCFARSYYNPYYRNYDNDNC